MKRRKYITGDTHGHPLQYLHGGVFHPTRTKDDSLVFITGDFGVLFGEDEARNEMAQLKWLDSRPWKTIVIGGNHDNWDRLRALPYEDTEFGVLQQISRRVYFVPNGTVLKVDGETIFCMGGAMSTDRGGLDPNMFYPGEGSSWWRGEIPTKEEMQFGVDNLEELGWCVDYVITHTMPQNSVREFVRSNGIHESRVNDPAARYLTFIKDHLTVRKFWYAGHFHRNFVYDGVQCLYHSIRNFETNEHIDDTPESVV